MLNIFLSIIARALICITNIQLSGVQLSTGGTDLLYDLAIRSKRSSKIKNAKYLLKYHSQSFEMCYRHIAKWGLAFYQWDWFCSMTLQSGQKGSFKNKNAKYLLKYHSYSLPMQSTHTAKWVQLSTGRIAFAL